MSSGRLDHPNIIKYYGNFAHANTLFIVMEYADRGDLAAVVKACLDNDTKLDEAVVAGWFVQIVAAMKHIHSQHILHRDVKTNNIFLSGPDPGIIKLGDFGIAKVRTRS